MLTNKGWIDGNGSNLGGGFGKPGGGQETRRGGDGLEGPDSGLAVPVFKQGDDPIDAINKMMSFLSKGRQSLFAAGTSGTRANISGTGGNNSAQGYSKVLNEEELGFLADLGVVEGPAIQKIITHNTAYQADDFDAYDSDCDDFSTAKAVLMANLSSYGSDVLSKEKETKNIDKEIALEKKVKEMDNIVCKMGQSAQTVHMLTKPQVFYDNNLKQVLGFQNPFYLKKSQQIRPMLYDGSVIAKETNVISIADSKEILMLEEESRSKMLLKQNFSKRFVPQQELSNEQAFWLQTLHHNTDQSASLPVKIKAPRELPKKQFLIKNDRLLDQIISQDIVNIVVNSSLDMNTSINVNSSVAMNDSVNYVEMKNLCHNSIKNDLRKFKGKDIVENAIQVSNATTIAPGMYKLDPVTLAPRDKNNRETHIYYLTHTMEQAAILREIVEQAYSLNPLDSASYTTCKYVKLIQELLGYVRDTCPDIYKPSEKLVVVTPINKKKIVSSMFDAKHELCFLEFVFDMNASSKSKFIKKAKKKKEWKPTGKVFTKIGYNWKPTGRTFTFVGNVCPLTRITATNKMPLREPIPLKVVAQEPIVTKVYTRGPKVVQIVLWYLDSECSRHMTGDRSQLTNFVHKFLGTIIFGNDQVAKSMGYGDYQIGNVTISRVYYVEGLGHNLFSVVGQFCDSDLEVAFRKHTCFVHNLEGVDLLSGSRGTNMYSLSIRDMMTSSPICLLSKATKTKSWLWHRRLSHLNFGALNHLARNGLVRGLPRLKFEKDHVCSACVMGKSKKQSHKPKSEDTNQEKLYLMHMDLCGPMHVASVNGKKYILVIVDDYSRFIWVKFLASNDEASDFIIKFLKMIQVRLNAVVRNIRTDNGTEFVNQTLRDYYEQVGISHETSVTQTPQQNGVVERRNRTLVKAA
ncbi:retrovirus-related pol polyprotein from transposon TNT 1-94 [Tanacetum coccineum]